MKQPLVGIAILWGIGLLFGLGNFSAAIVALTVLYFLYEKNVNKISGKHLLTIFGICLFAMLRMISWIHMYDECHEKIYKEMTTSLIIEDKTYEGRIVKKEKGKYSYVYTLSKWTVNGDKGFGAIRYTSDINYPIGDYITIKGKVKELSPSRNKGSFNYREYCRQKGIVAIISGKSNTTASENNGYYKIKNSLFNLREINYNQLKEVLPEQEADVMATLLLGLKSVDDETETLFRTAGLLHILAISGLHVSIIIYSVFKVVSKIITIKKAAVITVLCGWLYCIYTGMAISTIRATLMVTFFLLQYVVERRYDRSTTLSFSALVLMIVNPMQFLQVGFQLSFGAVASLFYIKPLLERYKVIRLEGAVIESLRAMISVQIGITPVLIYYFHTIPLYSLIGNLLVMPVVGTLLIFGLIGLIIYNVHWFTGKFVFGTVFWLLHYTLEVVKWIEGLPYNEILVGEVSYIAILMYYIILLLLLFEKNNRLIFLLISIFIVFQGWYQYDSYHTLKVDFIDVGQGDSALIRYKGEVIMIDGGGLISDRMKENVGLRIIEPLLSSEGINKIDTVFISHGDFDHIYGIIELAKIMTIDEVILPYQSKENPTSMTRKLLQIIDEKTVVRYMSYGDQYHYDTLSFTCLSPIKEKFYEDSNQTSLVLLMNYYDFEGIFTGDIYKEQEIDTMNSMARLSAIESLMISHNESDASKQNTIDFVKVSHHGSKSSTSSVFYEFVKPSISIISVGENNYGQPSSEVLRTLEEYSNCVLTTLDYGGISIESDGYAVDVDWQVK